MSAKTVDMTRADILDARAFLACRGSHGNPLAQTSTFERTASGAFDYDPDAPWARRRAEKTAAHARATS